MDTRAKSAGRNSKTSICNAFRRSSARRLLSCIRRIPKCASVGTSLTVRRFPTEVSFCFVVWLCFFVCVYVFPLYSHFLIIPGYLIGPVWNSLSGPSELMTYVEGTLLRTDKEWYVKGIIDMCEYQSSRIVRLLGSAKLHIGTGENMWSAMRPLLLRPLPSSDESARRMYDTSPNWYIGRAVGIFCSKEHLDGSIKALLSMRETDAGVTLWDGVPNKDVHATLKRSRSTSIARTDDWEDLKSSEHATTSIWENAKKLSSLLKTVFGSRGDGWQANQFIEDDEHGKIKYRATDHGLCFSKHVPPRNHTSDMHKTWYEIDLFNGRVQCCCFKCGFVGKKAVRIGTIVVTRGVKSENEENVVGVGLEKNQKVCVDYLLF